MQDGVARRSVAGLGLLIFLALSGCGRAFSGGSASAAQIDPPVPRPSGSPSPTVSPTPEPFGQVLRGWTAEYSAHVEARVAGDYPALLGLPDAAMTTVCPTWHALTRGTREKFWSALLDSIAGPESGRLRTAIYRETTLSIDSVTGQQIRSEGLLQLSYGDVVSYHYANGEISWENDRKMALADYASGTSSGNPERTILNAYSNLDLGLFIMSRLISLHPSDRLETAFGRYWSTMRARGAAFPTVLAGLKARIPACFSL